MQLSAKTKKYVGIACDVLAVSFVTFGAVALFQSAASAQTTGAIDTLKTDSAKVKDVYESVVPAAVGSTVFGIGSVLVKRVAFS